MLWKLHFAQLGPLYEGNVMCNCLWTHFGVRGETFNLGLTLLLICFGVLLVNEVQIVLAYSFPLSSLFPGTT